MGIVDIELAAEQFVALTTDGSLADCRFGAKCEPLQVKEIDRIVHGAVKTFMACNGGKTERMSDLHTI
ncbi:TetR/AcrR family transcriptional regulator C-terminal domain-containing protein [Rhizobium leguminosarum]|uniref:TetR/AcrR family transcriptional regulator C-terminal domain-containing protein n=1 Tax=Rhizobium leguminosarum TaxID=384 RepID=UPI003F9E13C0